VAFVLRLAAEDASLTPPELAVQIESHFGVRVHPRSIERALQRAKKTPTNMNTRAEPCPAATVSAYERLRGGCLETRPPSPASSL
jgi:transposase